VLYQVVSKAIYLLVTSPDIDVELFENSGGHLQNTLAKILIPRKAQNFFARVSDCQLIKYYTPHCSVASITGKQMNHDVYFTVISDIDFIVAVF
jgi:hypothetical protein